VFFNITKLLHKLQLLILSIFYTKFVLLKYILFGYILISFCLLIINWVTLVDIPLLKYIIIRLTARRLIVLLLNINKDIVLIQHFLFYFFITTDWWSLRQRTCASRRILTKLKRLICVKYLLNRSCIINFIMELKIRLFSQLILLISLIDMILL